MIHFDYFHFNTGFGASAILRPVGRRATSEERFSALCSDQPKWTLVLGKFENSANKHSLRKGVYLPLDFIHFSIYVNLRSLLNVLFYDFLDES